jgi:hypothetical protein
MVLSQLKTRGTLTTVYPARAFGPRGVAVTSHRVAQVVERPALACADERDQLLIILCRDPLAGITVDKPEPPPVPILGDIRRAPLMLCTFGSQLRLFFEIRSLFLLGCTRFGSPGIFGVSACYRPCSAA